MGKAERKKGNLPLKRKKAGRKKAILWREENENTEKKENMPEGKAGREEAWKAERETTLMPRKKIPLILCEKEKENLSHLMPVCV